MIYKILCYFNLFSKPDKQKSVESTCLKTRFPRLYVGQAIPRRASDVY